MVNVIANELRLLFNSSNPYTVGKYPIQDEDWELKQGEGESVINAWKVVLNYDKHDVSIRYADANTGMVIAWNFKNIKDFDDTLYRLEYQQ